MPRYLSLSVALTTFMWIGTQAHGATILSDDFSSYANTAALRTAWHNDSLFRGNSADIDPSTPPSYMINNNQRAYRDLPMTVSSADDWTLSFKALHTNFSRAQTVWLANYAVGSTTAYGVLWESTTASANGSEGRVSIRTYSGVNPPALNTTGTGVGGTPPSGHFGADGNDAAGGNDALDGPMAQFVLSWSAATKVLTLSVDGVVKVVTDPQATSIAPSFNRVYIIGNNDGWFDDVVVTSTPVPEPATVGLMGVAALLMLHWRR